ncbi:MULTISPECIES: hypothetical protein [Paenibacillus]|nr:MULTISPECIES: hypothetical protein [Paenibacillus]
MSKKDMIDALRRIGAHNRADELESYSDKNGNNWGWNGFYNKKK